MTEASDLTTLIERLEAAEMGSRRLSDDVLLATGWAERRLPMDSVPYWMHPDHLGVALSVANEAVTTSLDAALALAERVLPGIIWTVCRLPSGNALAKHGPFYATLESDDEWSPTLDQSAPTPALALCIAVLKAKKASQ
jgi:hypothetical protein